MAQIKDVAARAGVSAATVSHVINNSRKVGSAARDRVLQAIRDLGYTRNAVARSLVTGWTNLVGLLVSDIRNPFFPDVAASFQARALLDGVETLLMSTGFDPDQTLACVRRLIELRVPAVGIMTSEIDPAVCELLSSAGIRVVYLDVGHVGPYVSNISIDYEHGIHAALDHLTAFGHRRIGFIGTAAELQSIQRRKEGFLSYAASHSGLEVSTIDCDFVMRGGYMACAKLLTRFAPTAVVTVSDVVAIGAMHCAFDRGLAIPRDLSIIGFDDIFFAEFAHPGLTTVNIPRSDIGTLAYHALTEMVSAAGHQGKEYGVGTRLVVRESTGPMARSERPGVEAPAARSGSASEVRTKC